MGTLPTEMVAGKYYSIYDAYYKQVDPTNKGSVGAMDAANFLKTSGLTHDVLSKIWDLADSNAKGFLTRSGFFVALKLVALVQAGKEPTTANLSLDVPPPRMGDAIPNSNKVPPVNKIAAAGESEWAMKPTEKIKYDQLFDSLNPSNGFIPGSKVKGLLMDSKLPLDTLGKIWDLADMDKDGALDRHEFSVAMHLVYKALEKYAIPSSLPPELLPPGKKKDSISLVSGSIQVLPAVPPAVPNGVQSLTSTPLVPPASKPLIPAGPTPPLIPPISTAPLIPPISSSPIPSMGPPLIPSMKPNSVPIKPLTPPTQNAPSIPVAAAFPIDNFVTTEEPWVISKEEKIKYDALFEQADLDRDGFVNGHEIKDVFLKSGVAQPVLAHIWSLCDTAEQGKLNNEQFALALWLISRKLKGIEPPPKLTPEMIPPSCRKKSENTTNEPTVFTSPEVTRLTKEIEELTKEKLALETDITQREADIKIKTGEVKSLQGELDALVATLKQLENQKGEAAKRINDLKTQTAELESKIDDIKSELELEQIEVDKLRHQAEEQEKTLKQQESELNKKKQELDTLKKEEAALKKQREDLKNEIANVNKTAGETDELIVEIKEKLIELDDIQRQLKEAISHLDNVLESKNLTSLSEVYLQVEPKFRGESYSTLFSKIFKITGQNAADPFSNSEVDFSKTDSFASDPFCDGNAFKSDPFAGKDPFQSNTTANTVGFDSDPFASFNSGPKKPDPFDASPNPAATNAQTNEQDPFGGDPFAILHAPPKPGSNLPSPSSAPRAESPSPALPPKKSKQPPPRPAPPRPAPLSLPSGFDTDFADFSVLSHKPSGFSSTTSVKSDHSSKNDPFRDYRYDDPFEMADCSAPFRGASAPPMMDYKSAAFDPFMSTNGVSKSSTPVSSPLPPEDQQLAWATMESVRSEKERRKRAEQEKADFKLALKLSKQEGKKKSFRSKITLK